MAHDIEDKGPGLFESESEDHSDDEHDDDSLVSAPEEISSECDHDSASSPSNLPGNLDLDSADRFWRKLHECCNLQTCSEFYRALVE